MRRPYDASIQVRTHRTTLATLALFYKSKGIPVTSTSALTRRALEDFKDAIVLQGYVEEITAVGQAAEILDTLDIRSGSRTEKQLLTGLQLDEFKAEGIVPVFKGGKLIGADLPTSLQQENDPTLDVIRTIPDDLIAKEEDSEDE